MMVSMWLLIETGMAVVLVLWVRGNDSILWRTEGQVNFWFKNPQQIGRRE